MKKDVYRVLGFYPPATESAAVNYWVSGGKTKKDLPDGFAAEDIEVYANKKVKADDVLANGLYIKEVTATVPAQAVMKRTVMNNG